MRSIKAYSYHMFIALLIATTAAFILTSCGAQPTGGGGATNVPRIRKGPYLMYTGTNESMTVLWQLSKTVSECVIYWGTTESYGDPAITTENSATSEYHQYHYTITGLTPDQKYFYKVGTPLGTYESWFYTPPDDAPAVFTFYAYGDTRSNVPVHNKILKQILEDIDSNNVRGTFLLHCGDFAAYGLEENYFDSEFFYRNPPETLTLESRVPIFYALGNHDAYSSSKDWSYTSHAGRLMRKYWPYTFIATPERSYYSFEYGPVFVCVLDQYTKIGFTTPTDDTAQYLWASQEISASTKSWKVAMFHEPAWSARIHNYPTDTHGNHLNIQQWYHPIFKDNHVQNVIQGHNHFYSRCVTDEINYITTGGGGPNLHIPETGAQYFVTAESVYEFVKYTISGGTMTGEVFDENGSLINSFTVSP